MKLLKWKLLLAVVLLFVLYVVAGAAISYIRQPQISEEFQKNFNPGDCYSDTVSCERACIIEDNTKALIERLRLIDSAKDRIILSTFDFHADESGKDVIAALIAAAERGVDVKVLVDGFSAFMQMDGNEYFYALSTMENVEIRIYNRINLLQPWKSMGRLHDKYLIVDSSVYMLGGRNTYDYFLGDNGYKNYDRDVLVYTAEPENPTNSLYELEEYFTSVWNLKVCKRFYDNSASATKKKIARAKTELLERYAGLGEKYPEILMPADYVAMTYETDKITLLSNPTHVYAKEPTLFYALTRLMQETDGEVVIHTPYIICNEWMYQSLEDICSGENNVKLLTNSVANNGNPFGASDYRRNKGKLLETGLSIYEYEGGVSYHAKSITVGEELSIVGSFNMDMRSVYLDTELMLVIDSKDVNAQLRGYMSSYEARAAKVFDKEHYELPEGVERQELSGKKAFLVNVLSLLGFLRFLM